MRVSSSSVSGRLDEDATAFSLPVPEPVVDVDGDASTFLDGACRTSSAITALGWLLCCVTGRRIITCDLDNDFRAAQSAASVFYHVLLGE